MIELSVYKCELLRVPTLKVGFLIYVARTLQVGTFGFYTALRLWVHYTKNDI